MQEISQAEIQEGMATGVRHGAVRHDHRQSGNREERTLALSFFSSFESAQVPSPPPGATHPDET